MLAGYGDVRETMTYRCTAIGRMGGGEQWQNVWHFSGSWDDDPGGAEDAFTALITFYGDIVDRLYSGWHLDRLAAGDVGQPTSREDIVTGVDGEVSGAPMPNDCSVLVVWKTLVTGRRGTGRSFLGGWPLNACVASGTNGPGIVDGGPAGGVAAAAGTLLGDTTVEPVVYSRTSSSDEPITSGWVSRRWSTQRRRDLETPRSIVPFP
jgi:hypothetical protein